MSIDPNILAAQKWVNATYANAPGYVRCPEDGSTGWATVDCLTQALQHELGISPTVKMFGPTTLDAVRKRYRFPAQETNANIVRIYNAALWCKGFYGSPDPAVWDARGQVSLSDAVAHLGLIFDSNIDADLWARITRSLLRMDQFLTVPGGEYTTKLIQQHLNRRYVKDVRIPAMNLVPSDGIYSRDVQQGLMLAIQYELGLDKATINGNFGDGTKQALKTKGTGMSLPEDLARLFRAACWFNSPTWDSSGNAVHYDGDHVFSDNAWNATATWVNAFQAFSQLPTGPLEADTYNFQTWAQLLVSCGDTTRPAQGCDTAAYTSPERARALWAEDYRIIGRYLDEHLAPDDPYYLGKALKPGEAQAIIDSGMCLFPLFQYNGTQLANFTYEKGYDQGVKADTKAREHGIPHGSCIYFAVDYDAQDHDITSNVVPYFNGVRNALEKSGARYIFGVYGTRNVCERVSREAGARWSFVAGMSWGYSGNLGYPMPHNWSLNQIRQYVFQPGYDLDHNVWRTNSDRGVFRLATTDKNDENLREYIEFVKRIENVISDIAPGGSPRRDVIDGTLAFLRSAEPNYHDWKWSAILGDISDDIAAACADNGIEPDDMLTYYDPRAHHDITLAHFGAATEGQYTYGGSGTDATVGEGCGWAGDILNAYTQWRENHRELTGKDFCVQVVGSATVESRFGSDNLIADIDACNITRLLHNYDGEISSDDRLLSDALHTYHFSGGAIRSSKRFTNFYDNRFGGNRSTFQATVRNILLDFDVFSAFDWGKKFFLPADEAQWPDKISSAALDSFIDGLHTVITRRMEGE
ncbi:MULTISPECIES: glycoside hydrolase domain-containing protein [unclassified Streptomyces]|uniref:glycoside hydrolase domain-containing protein n=1 Tax=unclassified Streptomyces TaxID=2593676 RepID=UPI0036FECD8C